MITVTLLAAALIGGAWAAPVRRTGTYPAGKINVHLFAHTHDDPGWLKTVDQYYYGSNNSIYHAGVQYILDSVLDALEEDENRVFSYGEMSYFQRWYFDISQQKRDRVKRVVANGQLSFVNGGWVMHDEAAAHYVSMIDHTSHGHRFLKDEFDFKPRVGWQLDPFGHSSTQASLMCHAAGFDGLFFGRIDYQDLALRKESQDLEFIWQASPSMPDAEVFTGVFQDGNYGPPANLCFDPACGDDPVMDFLPLEDGNADLIMSYFEEAVRSEMSVTKGSHISFRLGSDFQYENANIWFKNVDKLIELVNRADGPYNVFYSTPDMYLDAKAQENVPMTTKNDDFFPYGDCEHCYWTGYFTSRPTSKLFERQSSSFLQTLRQLSVADKALPRAAKSKAISALTAAVGLNNHHDGISGTAKQHVAFDYMKILDKALTSAEDTSARVLDGAHPDSKPLVTCRLANESICSATQSLAEGETGLVVVYNSLARSRSQQVEVFLSAEAVKAGVTIYATGDSGQLPVYAEIAPSLSPSVSDSGAPYTLYFTASKVGAFATKTFMVRVDGSKDQAALLEQQTWSPGDALSIANGLLRVDFDRASGLMASMSRLDGTGASADVRNDMMYYTSFGSPGHSGFKYAPPDNRAPLTKHLNPADYSVGESSSQASGAYIFRPTQENELPTPIRDESSGGNIEQVFFCVGQEVSLVTQVFSSWASSTHVLRRGAVALETEWTVGPVPVDDKIGKEVIMKWDSSLVTQSTFYSDSNGREFLQRIKDFRPTWDIYISEHVAANYYPASAASYIKDVNSGAQLSVITDRSQGMSSLSDGSLEFMVHRRTLRDDARGVNEALNETTGGMSPYPSWTRSGDGITVRGRHLLLLSAAADGMRELREHMDTTFSPFAVFYGDSVAATNERPRNLSPVLGAELPVNVDLLTIEEWYEKVLLVRLAHQFAVDEDASLSAPVEVDIGTLLGPLNPQRVEEVTLTANQLRSDMEARKIRWGALQKQAADKSSPYFSKGSDNIPANLLQDGSMSVVLGPMEVRTFFVYVV